MIKKKNKEDFWKKYFIFFMTHSVGQGRTGHIRRLDFSHGAL
jgi:hypothetical protein